MRKVIVADNQEITKLGWLNLLQNFCDPSSIFEAAQKKELVHLLTTYPDALVIIDYSLFDFLGVSDLLILHQRYESVNWIICSEELTNDFLLSVLYNSDSFSVLLKDSSKQELQSVLTESFKGNRYVGNSVSHLLLDNSLKLNKRFEKSVLTNTERDILKEMALGNTTKEIATHRNVSVHTVMTHRKNIFRKIEVNNIHEATKYAMRSGLIDLTEYYI